jgi:methylation protein EvaC
MSLCRNCSTELNGFMTFGKMPIANAFLEKDEVDNEYFFELAPTFCPKCSLFQLKFQPDPSQLFHENYAFFANTSKKMQHHFEKLTRSVIDDFNLTKTDFIVEIGNNDGGMVKYFNDLGYRNHLGVDPSKNVCDFAKSLGVNVKNDFFNLRAAHEIKSAHGDVKVFFAANTLAHIADITSVFEGIDFLLSKDGVFVTEDPYLLDLLTKTSYDQIYDEHVFIFSLTSIIKLCENFDLEVFDVEKLETAGGSMRYYIARRGQQVISSKVEAALNNERKLNLFSEETYLKFKYNCEKSKEELLSLLQGKSKGSRVASYGATSKTTTIFNYCGIDGSLIEFITDTTPTKQNKLSPGMHIPIFDYEYFLNNTPEYCFLGAWNHLDEILEKEKNMFSMQGQWLTHTPYPQVVNF